MFSSEATTWQEAHFRCRDHDAQLAVLATQYEDNTVRSYLERPEFPQLGRWIGGMFVQDRWVWAAQGTEIESPTSFASEEGPHIAGGDEEWNCLFMDPGSRFKWSNENCVSQLHYICEAPLTKSSGGDGGNNGNATENGNGDGNGAVPSSSSSTASSGGPSSTTGAAAT